MSHGFELNPGSAAAALPHNPVLAFATRVLMWVNRTMIVLATIALVLTALVLTYSMLSRYFFKQASDWQDEFSVFLLVGATFFSTAYVQAQRGHVGIEALTTVLPKAVNAVRKIIVDIISFAFCTFFSWKSWTLFMEALREGQTSSTSWAPPLWIPYSLMAAGMTLLTIQILLQTLVLMFDSAPAKTPDTGSGAIR